jgi:hypothetical protein
MGPPEYRAERQRARASRASGQQARFKLGLQRCVLCVRLLQGAIRTGEVSLGQSATCARAAIAARRGCERGVRGRQTGATRRRGPQGRLPNGFTTRWQPLISSLAAAELPRAPARAAACCSRAPPGKARSTASTPRRPPLLGVRAQYLGTPTSLPSCLRGSSSRGRGQAAGGGRRRPPCTGGGAAAAGGRCAGSAAPALQPRDASGRRSRPRHPPGRLEAHVHQGFQSVARGAQAAVHHDLREAAARAMRGRALAPTHHLHTRWGRRQHAHLNDRHRQQDWRPDDRHHHVVHNAVDGRRLRHCCVVARGGWRTRGGVDAVDAGVDAGVVR